MERRRVHTVGKEDGMPIDELIREYEEQAKVVDGALARQRDLIRRMRAASEEQSDWVTVKEAASIAKVSIQSIYRDINTGRLSKIKHYRSKKYVSRSELLAIDDKYEPGYGEGA